MKDRHAEDSSRQAPPRRTWERPPARVLALLLPLIPVLAYGLVAMRVNREAGLRFTDEDGPVEWMTFGVLAYLTAYAFARRASWKSQPAMRGARALWLGMAAMFLFGTLEEISYGQRIFGWESPAWFLEHNRQQETNLHNLVAFGVNINKLVFGKILAISILLYVLVFPLLYRSRGRFRSACDRLCLPIARNYQIVLYILIAAVVSAHKALDDEINELMELGGVCMILAILWHPLRLEARPDD